MRIPATPLTGGTPAPSRLLLTAALLLPLALAPLTGCDATSPDGGPDQALAFAARSEADASESDASEAEIVVVEPDGTLRAFVEGEAGVQVAAPGDNRVAVLVTGSATFSSPGVPELRLNVQQTAGGAVSGGGRVTLRSAVTGAVLTTDFVATCVKPISGWGRTNYGVTAELAEPFRPFGSLAYTHVALSVTPDGHLDALVMNTRPFCGGSIVLNPPQNRLTGNVQVLLPGQ